MSATALPLPLRLNQPAPMVSDLDTQLKASLGVLSNTYNPETQVGVYGSRERQLAGGFDIAFTQSQSQTVSNNGIIVVEDMFIDDSDMN